MGTIVRAHRTVLRLDGLAGPIAAWLPLALLPVAAGALTWHAAGWIQMWSLAVAIYAGFKWATFATSARAAQSSLGEAAGYLFLWTGMDADAFLGREETTPTRRSQWAWALCQTVFGVWLLLYAAPRFLDSFPLGAGWLAMTGVVSVLHFGFSQFLSLVWRSAGVRARHIMDKPLFASSLADFWGRRWNLPFRDLMHRFVFQPLAPRVGGGWATMGVFLVSGLIHDAVISLSARGGWGLPTIYFLIQGVALLVERSRVGRRLGLGRGRPGRVLAAFIILAPAGLLFHPPFIHRVVLPMVEAFAGHMP
jgi:alginate O-acetyltransferase complex protein AlgI